MPAREYYQVPSGTDDGQRPCGRGAWCSASTRDTEGRWHPALSYQPFCPADRSLIARCLADLPVLTVMLAAQIGIPPRIGNTPNVSGHPGPRLLIRADVDALIRYTAVVLGSWHERVAMVASLAVPGTAAGIHRPARVTAGAVAVLLERVDALLALPPEPMARVMDPRDAQEWADAGAFTVVRPSGEAHVLPALSGMDAGLEILDLHYRARKLAGETRPPRETLDGIPCRECEEMALERAEPPSDPSLPAMHSRCAACKDEMDREEFGRWARQYAAWAAGAGVLTCRRCDLGRHGDCFWASCDCAASGHAAA